MPLLDELTSRLDVMVADLADLTNLESPTEDVDASRACADHAAAIGERLLGAAPEQLLSNGHTHLRWQFGQPRVVLIGHLDTVWPVGTLDSWPFALENGIATGPGVFDMKAGVVQLLHAVSTLDDLDGVAIVLNTDEETGSPSSRALITETVTDAKAALILEPGLGHAVKTARKGVSRYELRVTGRAAHAGLEPERGINATVELARQVLAIAGLAAPELGTSVTPTVIAGGTTVNTVPAEASVLIDARAETLAELARVDEAMRSLRAMTDGAQLECVPIISGPPMEHRMAAGLYKVAQEVAEELGFGHLDEVAVGGGSDGNLTAGLGIPTLDGLGAIGDGAHARGEHVLVAEMPRRAALLARLTSRL